jgi:hypothetical protein
MCVGTSSGKSHPTRKSKVLQILGRTVEVTETGRQLKVIKGPDVGLHDYDQIPQSWSDASIAKFLVWD